MKYVETNEKEGDDDYSIRAYEGKRKFKADIYKGETEYIQDDDLYYTEYQIRIVISDNTQLYLKYPETMPRIQSGVLQDHL